MSQMAWPAPGCMRNNAPLRDLREHGFNIFAEKRKQPMKNAQPLFDPATHYRLEVRGEVDAEWLQSFEPGVQIQVEEAGQTQDITVLKVRTDQSGIVGLVRRLHGLGLAILQISIVSE